MGTSFLSERPSVWPEREKWTPCMRAKRRVAWSDPAQECSTSPAGKGPSCRGAALSAAIQPQECST
jgi:hypothetical protein